MKNTYKILFFLLHCLAVYGQELPERPNPPHLVNDLVGMLSQTEINQLEQKLVAYNDSTSTQIAVVVVKSIEPYEIADYAQKLGRKWGVGQAEKNNGIVIVWCPSVRKITIQTGYGMEGALPDAYAKRIIEQEIKPNFRELRYYEGLNQATDRIINYAKGEFEAEASGGGDIGASDLIPIFIFFLILMVIIYIISKNSGGNNGTRRRYHDSTWFPYTTHSGWGSSSGSWGSSGGGGGSFGGFGGGDFGGGGASGDY